MYSIWHHFLSVIFPSHIYWETFSLIMTSIWKCQALHLPCFFLSIFQNWWKKFPKDLHLHFSSKKWTILTSLLSNKGSGDKCLFLANSSLHFGGLWTSVAFFSRFPDTTLVVELNSRPTFEVCFFNLNNLRFLVANSVSFSGVFSINSLSALFWIVFFTGSGVLKVSYWTESLTLRHIHVDASRGFSKLGLTQKFLNYSSKMNWNWRGTSVQMTEFWNCWN